MTVKAAAIWTFSIAATLALAFAVWNGVNRFVFPPKSVETKASRNDAFIESMIADMQGLLPRMFPGTSDINQALKNFQKEKSPAVRTELAYDLVALKFQEDLRGRIELSGEQAEIFESARSHLKWAQDLLAYYIAHLPDNQIGAVNVKIGESTQALPPSIVRKILAGRFAPKKDQCTEKSLENLKTDFPEEFLAMNLTPITRLFLALQGQIDDQLIGNLKEPLLAAVSDARNREVIESLFKIRANGRTEKTEISARMKQLADTFANEKDRELAFSVYAYAPECFKSSEVVNFTRVVQKFKSQVKAKFYIGIIREYYKKNRELPKDIYDLRLMESQNPREDFFRSPSDAYGSKFEMKVEGNRVQLISIGRDHKPGTEDDFVAADGDLNETL